jgi:hypothetical protein
MLPPAIKQRVRESFDRAAVTYDAAAVVQRRVCDRLLEADKRHPRAGAHSRRRLRYRLRRTLPALALAGRTHHRRRLRAVHARNRRQVDRCLLRRRHRETAIQRRPALRPLVVQPDHPVVRRANRLRRSRTRTANRADAWRSARSGRTLFSNCAKRSGIDRHRHTLPFSEADDIAEALLTKTGFSNIALRRENTSSTTPT